MKVLVADDDQALAHLLSSRLKKSGFRPITAQDAVQAWLAVQRSVPSVVVLDIQMPGGTGRAVLKSLKQSEKTKHIPVMAISAMRDLELAGELRRMGAESFLPKPVDLNAFDAEICRLSSALLVPQRGVETPLAMERTEAGTEAGAARPNATHRAAAKSVKEDLADAPAVQRCPNYDRKIRVLVAEDDAALRHTLRTLLTRWGYNVISASNGHEAVEAFNAKEPPEIAILDWMMPLVDGVEVCRNIRKRPSDSYTYVVLLTAKSAKQELVEAMHAGADDYIVKPFDSDELKMRISAGQRIVELQEELLARSAQLRSAVQLLAAA